MRRPFALVTATAAVTLAFPSSAATPSADEGTAGTHPTLRPRVPATSPPEVVPPVTVRESIPDPTSSLDTVPETVSSGEVTPAEAVAWCESRGSLTAENPHSSASGRFQFIDSTWTAVTGLEPPASRYPAAIQHAAFHELWDDGRGAHHWNPSRSCWAPLIGEAA